ncbi:fimbria/pilus outer membrane usher protein [Pseudomonas sp. DTU_2021_1001937_2_SI_NGA_ILE_001]|uniref:fimbria/pilus outer membrane usher protein n=1 Tax=Pseudomonas sp. DTU_2021_1001937_2_SI_NGA_ILE_001 TaxID=3077589 RepID=UPI0028FC0EF5|nr:fimbria/pilus outer membrane usher protein [Pseudomonas sp. DTU_2021_1001937_2_SI_NGA_ILE_001]WNW10763.1 fimbria/pilus outer membrane usher protein [Pseudomonas sp. DTU_2021_1001937_2_SI_NGA_ILE_001]
MKLLPGCGHRRVPACLPVVHPFILGSSALLLATPCSAAPPTVEFQSSFMRQAPGQAHDAGLQALQALAAGQDLAPGDYKVQISINRRYFGIRELRFDLDPSDQSLRPCLSAELLEQLGVRLQGLEPPALQGCVDLPKLLPGATLDFDTRQLQLAVSVPQIAMRRSAIGEVDPALWDHGINAAFVNYQVSAQQSSHRQTGQRNSDDLYLNAGLNLGAWRLRSNHSMRHDEQGRRDWTRAYTYLQRDLPGTRATMTLGETFTGGEVFRSVPIRGLLIRSDLEMLSDSLQGYAPVIRGVAQSRAKLEVLQNGYPIYSTYVSAGPYAIDDLTTAGSGELEIVLTEEDGQVRRFTQPYSTINNLLREGVWQYSGAIGRYHTLYDSETPLLWQGTLSVGLGWNATLYGGLLASDGYRATALGLARDLGALGGAAFDVTRSEADILTADTRAMQGLSYALKYGKAFTSGTHLRFAGYRYSTEGYRDFDEAISQRSTRTRWRGSRRSRLEASVHQKIGNHSSLSLTFSHQDYWGSDHEQRQYQLNFSTRHANVTYNLHASQSLSNARNRADRQLGLSISMPLDWKHASNATFDLLHQGDRQSQRVSLGGSLDRNRLSYRVGVNHESEQGQVGSLSVGYQAPFASVGAGVAQGHDYRSVSLNASGAVLLHAGGVELGTSLGETNALVEVPGIEGVGVQNAIGARTSQHGYALVPYLRPYRFNAVTLETDDLGPEVEIDNGTTQVVPSRGAVVKARFAARKVSRLMLTARSVDGRPLPFGAQVTDRHGEVLGTVGQAGQVLLATRPEAQTLQVSWGESSAPQCRLSIDPSTMPQRQGYRMQEVTCD